jgi:hypothetical protein
VHSSTNSEWRRPRCVRSWRLVRPTSSHRRPFQLLALTE